MEDLAVLQRKQAKTLSPFIPPHLFKTSSPTCHCCSAESVQVNVVVFWLEDLAALQRQLGRQSAAAECLKKALHYMEGDKGQVMAQVRGSRGGGGRSSR